MQTSNAVEITESLKALFDSLMAELRLSGKDRNKSITTKAAKELIAIKEKTLESQQKQTKLLKELEFTTREAEKLTRRIMDDEDERKEEGNESPAELVKGSSIGDLPIPLSESDDELLRRDRSATLIQSRFRGHLAQKKYKEMFEVQTAASRVIQKHYRRHQDSESERTEKRAITTIQAGARKWKANREVKQKRTEEANVLKGELMERAAKTLQRHERARQTRKKFKEIKEVREEKAVMIQKHFRSRKAKEDLEKRRSDAPRVEDFGIFCNDQTLTAGSLIRACGRPSNGTTLCMFQWTRRDQVTGKMCDIPGETTPEYVLSPDDVGRVVGVRCTPTNDKDECGLPATDVVNNGSPIEISDEVKKEITNLASKGTVTYHTQLVKFGKSSIPTQVTVTLDKKMVTVTKKEKVLLKMKWETLPRGEWREENQGGIGKASSNVIHLLILFAPFSPPRAQSGPGPPDPYPADVVRDPRRRRQGGQGRALELQGEAGEGRLRGFGEALLRPRGEQAKVRVPELPVPEAQGFKEGQMREDGRRGVRWRAAARSGLGHPGHALGFDLFIFSGLNREITPILTPRTRS